MTRHIILLSIIVIVLFIMLFAYCACACSGIPSRQDDEDQLQFIKQWREKHIGDAV